LFCLSWHGLSHYDRVSHYDRYLALVLPESLSRWLPSTSGDNSISVQQPRSLGLRRRKSFMLFIVDIFAIPSNSPPDRPICRPTVQYAARPSNSPLGLLPDRPIRRPIDQNAGRPSNSPLDSLPDRPIRRPIEQNAARPSDTPLTVQFAARIAARPSNSPSDRPKLRQIVPYAARPSNSPPDHPIRRPIRRPTVQFDPFRLICSPSAQFNRRPKIRFATGQSCCHRRRHHRRHRRRHRRCLEVEKTAAIIL
jgi:hypothetical protein